MLLSIHLDIIMSALMRKFLTHLKDTSTNQTRDQVLIVTHLCKAYNEGFDACSGNSNGNDNSGSSDNLNLNSNDNSGQSSNSGSGSHSGLVDKGCNLINKHPAAATLLGHALGLGPLGTLAEGYCELR